MKKICKSSEKLALLGIYISIVIKINLSTKVPTHKRTANTAFRVPPYYKHIPYIIFHGFYIIIVIFITLSMKIII